MTRCPLAERLALYLPRVGVVCGAVVVAPLLAMGWIVEMMGRITR